MAAVSLKAQKTASVTAYSASFSHRGKEALGDAMVTGKLVVLRSYSTKVITKR